MFLSAAIDSGIGLTAGKKLCGKTIAQSDDTYLTTVNLRQKFIQLKKFLAINVQPQIETEKIEPLKNAINKLQEDSTQQKTIINVISEENLRMKKQFEQLQPMIEFVNSFDAPENLKTILGFLKEDFLNDYAEGRLRPLKTEFSPYIAEKLNEIAKNKGITQKEALSLLLEDNLKTMSNAENVFRKLEKRSRKTARPRKPRA